MFTSLYWLLKDVPAGRQDFTVATRFAVWPKRLCQTRWTENVNVAKRFLKICLFSPKHIAAVREKKATEPKKKSFMLLTTLSNTVLFPVQVQAFLTFAKDVLLFPRKYQMVAPTLPFLSADLQSTVCD